MIDTIRKILASILQALYQPFVFALILSILALFFYIYLDKYKDLPYKEKMYSAIKEWKNGFLKYSRFRRIFYFVFFTTMVLFKTLMNRNMTENPLSDVIGVWGLYDRRGIFTTQVFENTALFIPFTFFLFLILETTQMKTMIFAKVIRRAFVVSFSFSLIIEMLQLFMRLGTWQLSDLFFNTLGGVIGGVVYWLYSKVHL